MGASQGGGLRRGGGGVCVPAGAAEASGGRQCLSGVWKGGRVRVVIPSPRLQICWKPRLPQPQLPRLYDLVMTFFFLLNMCHLPASYECNRCRSGPREGSLVQTLSQNSESRALCCWWSLSWAGHRCASVCCSVQVLPKLECYKNHLEGVSGHRLPAPPLSLWAWDATQELIFHTNFR